MTALQRSATSFRRQGSSGTVWDDKFLEELSDQLNQTQKPDEEKNQPQEEDVGPIRRSRSMISSVERTRPIGTIGRTRSEGNLARSRSNGGGGPLTARRVLSPALEPPSPRISACGFCFSRKKDNLSGLFRKKESRRRRPKSGKRRM